MYKISYLTGAAVALVVAVSSVSAADEFATLEGIEVEPLSAAEMDTVAGLGIVPETIHIYTDTGEVHFNIFHRGEPVAPGPPPSVYVNDLSVSE